MSTENKYEMAIDPNTIETFTRYYEKRSETKKVYKGEISMKHEMVWINNVPMKTSQCFALYRPITKEKYMEKRKWVECIQERKN